MASAFSTCITWGGRQRSGERRPCGQHDTQGTPTPNSTGTGHVPDPPQLQGLPSSTGGAALSLAWVPRAHRGKQLANTSTILLSKPGELSTSQSPTVFPPDTTAHRRTDLPRTISKAMPTSLSSDGTFALRMGRGAPARVVPAAVPLEQTGHDCGLAEEQEEEQRGNGGALQTPHSLGDTYIYTYIYFT